jgi:hypothetical protein
MSSSEQRNHRKVQKEFKRLAKIEFGLIDYFLNTYLESKKIQQFRHSFLNELRIFRNREPLQKYDSSYLENYFMNYFEPEIFDIVDSIDDILQYFNKEIYEETLKHFQKFAKLCIQHIDIKLEIMKYSSPIELLKAINFRWMSKSTDIRRLYDPEMITYIMQNCPNTNEVLKLIPLISNKDLIEGGIKWHIRNRRKNAAIKIQRAYFNGYTNLEANS